MSKKALMFLTVAMVLLGGLSPVRGAQAPEKERPGPEGNAARGEVLFNKPLVLGPVPISCATCHPDGRGVEKSYGKDEYSIFGYKTKKLEAVVDFLIVNVLQGKGIRYNSQEMADLKAYMKSLSMAGIPERPLQKFVPMHRFDDLDEPNLYGE